MREFFKPWRRKLGVVTLGLALAFTTLWIRSFATCDESEVRYGDTIYSIRSCLGGVALATEQILTADSERRYRIFTSMPLPQWCPQVDPDVRAEPESGLETTGFYFGGDPESDLIFAAPYWSIVIPLTLLSAHLLLNKSRQKPTQPVIHA